MQETKALRILLKIDEEHQQFDSFNCSKRVLFFLYYKIRMSARLLKDPATASSRIFVGHLQTDDVTKLELEEHFSKYGTVIASIINRGFGFVQFEDEQSAQKAIQNEDGAQFKGRRIGMS